MTARPDPLRVVVLADGDHARTLRDVLAGLGCAVTAASDLFDAVATIDREDPDAIVVDLTSTRDDPRALAHWVGDNGVAATLVGLVDPVAGVADGDLDELCDELVLAPPTAEGLGAALDLAAPATGDRDRRLTVKIHAALFDPDDHEVPPAPDGAADGATPGLIVGLGAHAEAPRYHGD